MRAEVRQTLPPARTKRLVIKELPDELLVYDLDRHKAHCLNKTSAFIWKHCDGKTTVAEIAALLKREFAATVDEDVVWLALGQLRKFHLLEEGSATTGMMKVSRRDLVSKYLPAALVLPVILSIASPTAAQSASNCGSGGAPCGGPTDPPCCAGFACNSFINQCQAT
jgi:hypothetical protein